MTPAASSNPGMAHRAFRILGVAGSYFLLGTLASLVAALTGTVLLFALVPFIVFYAAAMLIFPLTLSAIYYSVISLVLWAAPATFLLFPIAGWLLRNSLVRYLALPAIGALAGWATVHAWNVITATDVMSINGFALLMGAIPGFASGAFYAHGLKEMGR